jgi:hypothetical protein
MDPTASLDAVAKRKTSLPLLDLKPGHPAHSLVTILTLYFMSHSKSIKIYTYKCKGKVVPVLK